MGLFLQGGGEVKAGAGLLWSLLLSWFSLPLQDRLEHLRKQCGPHVSAAAKDSVEGICSKIYHISLEYVKRIREKHLAILKEHSISGSNRGVGRAGPL